VLCTEVCSSFCSQRPVIVRVLKPAVLVKVVSRRVGLTSIRVDAIILADDGLIFGGTYNFLAVKCRCLRQWTTTVRHHAMPRAISTKQTIQETIQKAKHSGFSNGQTADQRQQLPQQTTTRYRSAHVGSLCKHRRASCSSWSQ
jgi:hypothetical protein